MTDYGILFQSQAIKLRPGTSYIYLSGQIPADASPNHGICGRQDNGDYQEHGDNSEGGGGWVVKVVVCIPSPDVLLIISVG